jgi:hypothetical protein
MEMTYDGTRVALSGQALRFGSEAPNTALAT